MTAHPGIVLLATAGIVSFLKGRAQKITVVAGCSAALVAWSRLDASSSADVLFGDYRLSLLRADPASLVFGLVFGLIALIGTLYSLHDENRGERVAALVYAGSSLGVVFAGDWITLFVFWELMAISSLFVIWQGNSPRTSAAGFRYLLVHAAGGSVLFAGILVHFFRGGPPNVGALTTGDADPLAFWLILLGVGLSAAIPPLHAWLTDAYPEASITGSIYLSAFTTKTAVYVLLRLFPGAEVLVWAGAVMSLYGVFFAVIENEIRRLLSYHIVSQVGYMVTGVGLGTALALDGAAAHAYSHILYKALLFMGAGAVIYATGARKLTELGGIASRAKLVLFLYMVGAFSISGVPLFNGFISKSMVVSAAAESHQGLVELTLHLASVGTFLSIGLKLPYFTFFGERRDVAVRAVPWNMIAGMGAAAALCIVYGLFPGLLYRWLPYGSDYHPYTPDHLVSSTQLLVATAFAFFLLLDRLKGKDTISLDTDWLYRVALANGASRMIAASRAAGAAVQSAGLGLVATLEARIATSKDPRAVDYDPNRFPAPIGLTVFWITVYFALIAIAAFIGLS